MDYKLFEATLGGVAFSSLAEELLLLDIVETPIEMQTETMQLAFRAGSVRTMHRRKSLEVELRYMIRTQDIARRSAVRNLVAGWAEKGGTLKVNTRPDMRLVQVKTSTPPSLGSSAKWTDELTVTFVCYGLPYWQSATTDKINIQTTYNAATNLHGYHGIFHPIGNAESVPLTAMLQNTGSGSLTNIEIAAGETFVELVGIDIPAGGTIVVTMDENSLFNIVHFESTGGISLLPYRTADSSDELRLKYQEYGDSSIAVYADAPITGNITVRRLWV